MSDVKIDYFKASFTSDGNTGDLEVDDNGNIFYKNLDEEDLMKLVNVMNNPSSNTENLLEKLKTEFPLKEEKSRTKKKAKKDSEKAKKEGKKAKKSRRSKITESIDSVLN